MFDIRKKSISNNPVFTVGYTEDIRNLLPAPPKGIKAQLGSQLADWGLAAVRHCSLRLDFKSIDLSL